MKLTLCLIATLLLISFSSSLASSSNNSGYQSVAIADVKKSSLIMDLLKFGIARVFKSSAAKYNVSSEDVEVIQINSVFKLQLKTKTYYNFSVEADNVNGDVLDANFTVEYVPKTKQRYLRNWTSDLRINHDGDNGSDGDSGSDSDGSDDGFVAIAPSDYNSKTVQALVAQGIAYVVKNELKKIPQYTYYLDEIVSASKKSTADADYYRFDVKAENKKGSSKLRIWFTSEVQNGTSKVLHYWFSPK